VTTTIASGATTHSAGVTYRYAVQVKNDQIDIISQSTVTTTGITIISQTGVTYNNAAAQNQIGFNYYKGSAEASAYNTYLNNFVIFDLGSQSTVLGEFQAQDDIQFKTFSQIDRDSQNTADIIYQKDIVKIAIDGTTTTDVQFKGFSTATKNDVISPTDITTIENSLLFDGNGDYVNTGVTTIAGVGLFATSTSVWSIEFWFNSTAFAATGSADYLINRSAGPNSSRTFQIRVNDTGNIISFVRGSSTTLATSTTAPLDSWNHLALTWNGTNAYAYLNGGATIAVSVGTAAEQTSEFIVFGGDNNSNVVSYNGYLSDIRIWNTARTQTQIQTNRSQRIYGQSGLIGYWKLNEATGSTIAYDSLGNINAPVTGAGFTQNSVFIIAPNSLVKAITKPQQDGITTTDVQFKSLSKSLTADGITTTDITSKLLAKSLSDSQGSTDSQIVKRFAIIPSDEVITVSGIIRGKAFSDTVYSLDGPYERYSNYAIGYVFGSSLPIKIQQQIIQKLEISSRIITNKRNQ
ncbi:MAG: LamG domain-containing protein, partial [Caulobacteraceae bacterium]|nr:LamG domain-containing protein [Caulobacteraceae bacterium]